MKTDPQANQLLARTMLTADKFEVFLTELEQEYPSIGRIERVAALTEGYEDANFTLETDKGKYVLKIFAEDMSVTDAQAHAKILAIASKSGVPAAVIETNKSGEVLTTILDNYCFVTRFSEGESFENKRPEGKDMKAVTEALVKLNKNTDELAVSYDSWGNSDLLREYKRDKELLSDKEIELILSTI